MLLGQIILRMIMLLLETKRNKTSTQQKTNSRMKMNILCSTSLSTSSMGSKSLEKDDGDSSRKDEEKEAEAPTTVITIAIPVEGKENPELFKVLLDTGTNRNMGTKEAVHRFQGTIKTGKQRSWTTAAGKFVTTSTAKIKKHSILELIGVQLPWFPYYD